MEEEMFSNLALGPMLICTPQINKKQQLKAIYSQGMFPLIYIPKEKMDRSFLPFGAAIDATPNILGVIVAIYYYQIYY